jgi:DNA-binding transcriptional LysR family regulator
MELRQLQYFVAIAKLGSFRRAADELNVSQAALSQQMKLLEAEARVPLIERGHRPLTLTEAGHALLGHAELMLREASLARDDLQGFAGLQHGHLRIGTLPAHGASFAVPLVGAFHAAHPNIQIDVAEYSTGALFDLLLARAIDVACVNVPGPGSSPQPGIRFQPIQQFELVFVVHPAHRFSRLQSVELEEVARETLIMPPRPGSVSRIVEQAFAARGLTPQIGLHSSDALSLLEMAAAQFGVVVISRRAYEAHPRLGLHAVEPRDALLQGCGGLAWTERGERTNVVAAMVSFARSWRPT